jgi:hypothetical protein
MRLGGVSTQHTFFFGAVRTISRARPTDGRGWVDGCVTSGMDCVGEGEGGLFVGYLMCP